MVNPNFNLKQFNLTNNRLKDQKIIIINWLKDPNSQLKDQNNQLKDRKSWNQSKKSIHFDFFDHYRSILIYFALFDIFQTDYNQFCRNELKFGFKLKS